MTINKYMLISICSVCFSLSTHAQLTCQDQSSLDWLLGTWESKSDKRTYTETWHSVSRNTFEGESRVTAENGELTSKESLRLVLMQNSIFYLAKVAHNPLPIAFSLTQCDVSTLKFENPSHDFPTSLKYELMDEGRLKVEVRGNQNDGFNLVFHQVD